MFSLPFEKKKRNRVLFAALGLTAGLENSWSVCHHYATVQAEKRKKQKKEVRAGEFRAMQKERKKSAGGARYIN